MRIVGYDLGGTVHVADLLDEEHLLPLGDVDSFWADPDRAIERAGSTRAVSATGLELCPPLPASARVVCVGLNYRDHVAEGPFAVPEHPEYFARWTPALGVSGRPVVVPRGEPGLDWEAELAVAIGRRLRDVDEDEARDGIFGYAAFNDLTARRAQHRGRQWTLGKNVDGSGVLGAISPAAETGDPCSGWPISAHVNGERVQSSSTDRMIFSAASLIADLAAVLTLRPGDIIATGTPDGVGHRMEPPRFLGEGDVVTVTVGELAPVTTEILLPIERA